VCGESGGGNPKRNELNIISFGSGIVAEIELVSLDVLLGH
jgi:hypothetical protein